MIRLQRIMPVAASTPEAEVRRKRCDFLRLARLFSSWSRAALCKLVRIPDSLLAVPAVNAAPVT